MEVKQRTRRLLTGSAKAERQPGGIKLAYIVKAGQIQPVGVHSAAQSGHVQDTLRHQLREDALLLFRFGPLQGASLYGLGQRLQK